MDVHELKMELYEALDENGWLETKQRELESSLDHFRAFVRVDDETQHYFGDGNLPLGWDGSFDDERYRRWRKARAAITPEMMGEA